MKKCENCKIVFHHPDRTRCLYCHHILTPLGEHESLGDAVAYLSKEDDTTVVLSNAPEPLGEIIWKKDSLSPEDARYVIGTFFKSRSFYFFYGLSRNELKMEQKYKRFFVHPWNFKFLVMLPWAAVNLVDSLLFHLRYRSYCPTCKWKFAGRGAHDPKECAYNREYTLVINAILSGFIGRLEPTFHSQALLEVKRGQPSAYFDLCHHNESEKFLDIASVVVSVGLMVYIVVGVLIPLAGKMMGSLNKYERMEINFLSKGNRLC